MGVRTAQDRGMQGSGTDREIVDIAAATGQQPRVFQTARRLRKVGSGLGRFFDGRNVGMRFDLLPLVNFGRRFSFQAATPSLKSRICVSTVIAFPSIWKPPASETSGAWVTTDLAKAERDGREAAEMARQRIHLVLELVRLDEPCHQSPAVPPARR